MSVVLTVGQSQQMASQILDTYGNTLFGVGVPVWSSSNTAVATVGASGLVTGVGLGTASITASLGGVAGSSVATIVQGVSDSFNRTDNASSLGTADTGQVWSALGGTWGISGNKAYLSANNVSGSNVAVVDSGQSNASVSAAMAGASAVRYVAFRVSDVSNFLIAGMQSGSTADVYKCVAGSFTNLISVAHTWVDGDSIKITFAGSALTVFVNGVQVGTASDGFNSTATKHGLFAGNDVGAANASWDNFLVTVP